MKNTIEVTRVAGSDYFVVKHRMYDDYGEVISSEALTYIDGKSLTWRCNAQDCCVEICEEAQDES